MSSQDSAWFLREFFFSRNDKSAQTTFICKGICFQIQSGPANFSHSPSSLQTYTHLMDTLCNDEDSYLAEEAEEELYTWALSPFLPIFANVDPSPSNSHPFTLRDYLHPKIYRCILFVTHESLEPRPNYEVPEKLRPRGVDLSDFTLLPNWCKVRPEDIQITAANGNELYSRLPRKVLAGGATCFLKPLEHDDRRAAIRELGVYKQRDTLGLSNHVQVPRLIGVVQDEHESHIISIPLNWVQCDNRTLQCSLRPENSFGLRKRWDTQATRTLDCLHEADIIWGDAKATNVLIDANQNAWLIDFGGRIHTRMDREESYGDDQRG